VGLGFRGVTVFPDGVMASGLHKFIRGNHDDPTKHYRHRHYLGDYGYDESTGIFWLSGGFSIDRQWRVPMVSWWPGEELSSSELDKAFELYVKSKPRFVISHEAPLNAATWLLTMVAPGFRPEKIVTTRTGQKMEYMLDFHKPEKWIFGHYHIDKTFTFSGVEYTCVNELSTYLLDTEAPSVLG